MSTTVWRFANGKTLSPLSYLNPSDVNNWSDSLESVLVLLADLLGATVRSPTDFAGSIVAGELSIQIATGIGFPGAAGAKKIVWNAAAVKVLNLTASDTNYLYLLQEADPVTGLNIVANVTGVAPADSCLLLTCVTDGTEVTSIDDAPAGRTHLGSALVAARRLMAEGTSVSIAGGPGDVTLIAGEFDTGVLTLTGLLTGNRNVILETLSGRFLWVKNDTTGAFTVTVKTAAGTGVEVTQGSAMVVWCDATNIVPLDAEIGVDVQAHDDDLDAVAALATTGIATRTAGNTWALRTLTAPSDGFGITNPAGVAGNPTFALVNTILDAGRPATGFLGILSNPADGRTLQIDVTPPGGVLSSVVYEFDDGGGVGAGNVQVLIGGTAALTATALRAAIVANQGTVLNSAVHPTDTAYIDIATVEPGATMTLTSSHPAEVAAQDNADELVPAVLYEYTVQHTVTAAEVAWGRVVIITGLSDIRRWHADIDPGMFDGSTSDANGQVEFVNDGVNDLVAGDVIVLDVKGTL